MGRTLVWRNSGIQREGGDVHRYDEPANDKVVGPDYPNGTQCYVVFQKLQ